MATAAIIPLANSQELLVVEPSELSDDIIRILQRENVKFEIWMDCARGFLSQGRVDEYTRLLNSLISEVQRRRDYSPQAIFIHVQAICSLADLYQQQARLTEDSEQKRKLNAEANKLYFEARRIEDKEMLPYLGLGELALSTVRSNYCHQKH